VSVYSAGIEESILTSKKVLACFTKEDHREPKTEICYLLYNYLTTRECCMYLKKNKKTKKKIGHYFTYLHDVPNSCDFNSYMEHKRWNAMV